MPIHDWTTVRAGTFHNFHFGWVAAIRDRLNAGLLPPGFFAMAEQVIGGPEPDVVSLHTRPKPRQGDGSVAVAPTRPKATFVMPVMEEKERYARKANRIAVHHELGNVVAVIEIVSPGNKGSKHAIRSLVEKTCDLIRQGVNLLVIDLFPPSVRDPRGVHGLILDEITDQPFELPPDRPLTLAAYQTAPTLIAYVEPLAVGDPLPDMPLFLYEEYYIHVPLEETYQTTWNVLPVEIRQLLEPPPAA
jgi:hypothetical protein